MIDRFAGEHADNIKAWWKQIEDQYNHIHVNSDSDDYVPIIRDYSIKAYEAIIGAINSFDQKSISNPNGWNSYSGESWFGRLMVAIAIKCINNYNNRLSEMCKKCKTGVNNVFENIGKVDTKYSKRMIVSASNVRSLTYQIKG